MVGDAVESLTENNASDVQWKLYDSDAKSRCLGKIPRAVVEI